MDFLISEKSKTLKNASIFNTLAYNFGTSSLAFWVFQISIPFFATRTALYVINKDIIDTILMENSLK